MKGVTKFAASMLLAAAFAIPAAAAPQVSVRIYDPVHRDYHRWDDREDRAYRAYWTERYKERQYREYRRLKKDEQRDYWRWRHEHHD